MHTPKLDFTSQLGLVTSLIFYSSKRKAFMQEDLEETDSKFSLA